MTWQLQEAKNRFSELARRAEIEGPQEITRHRRQRFILATIEDWQQRHARKRSKTGHPLRSFFDRYRGLDFHSRRRKVKVPRSRL